MKRIVILSDTHGLLRPEVLDCLSQADAIIHGGDINTQAIVDALQGFAHLYIVRGNNDKEWAENLPHSLTFAIEGVRFFQAGCAPGLVRRRRSGLRPLPQVRLRTAGRRALAQPRKLRQAAFRPGDHFGCHDRRGRTVPSGEDDHSP